MYIWTLLLIAAAAVVFVRIAGGRSRPMATFTDLFFMGSAFLFLETKSVVQFAQRFDANAPSLSRSAGQPREPQRSSRG